MIERQFIAEIYKQFSRELYIYIYRYVGSQETSEDILQDTFHNLIKYSRNHDFDKNRAKAFLYKTAHNLCINFRKRHSRISFPSLEEAGHLHDKNIHDNSDLEKRELEERIFQLLEKTDPFSKSVFIMKKELNMKIEEIAENTGKSTRTIRRKLEKLLSFLYDTLKKEGLILLFFIIKVSLIHSLIVL